MKLSSLDRIFSLSDFTDREAKLNSLQLFFGYGRMLHRVERKVCCYIYMNIAIAVIYEFQGKNVFLHCIPFITTIGHNLIILLKKLSFNTTS